MTNQDEFSPATPAQIKYAISLGISFDPNESLESLSDKISFKLDAEHFITIDQSISNQAKYFGIHSPDSSLRDHVLRCITDSVLVANRTHDLCHWFIYRVFLHLAPGAKDTSPASDSTLFKIASLLQEDQKFVSSARNEAKRCNLDKFGTPIIKYGVYPRIASTKTYAYRIAVHQLRTVLFAQQSSNLL